MLQGFDPRKFLELAKDLTIDGDYEKDARARTAMGRLYYSVFLLAWQKLQEKGVPIKNDDKIHQSVIETYNDNRLSTIGNGLHQLREKRRVADYHMMDSVTLGDCRKCIELSEYIIGLIDQVREIK
jgi:hypothetical protein